MRPSRPSDGSLGHGDLAGRLAILRDEVLETAQHGDDAPGAAVFDAMLRALMVGVEATVRTELPVGDGPPPGVDGILASTLDTQLAWGGREGALLAEIDAVFDRLMLAVDRAIDHPGELILVVDAAGRVFAAAASYLARAAVARAGRDRAQRVRDELVLRQLDEALAEQVHNIARLRAELPDGDF